MNILSNSEQLKQSTARQHQQLEKVIIGKIRSIKDIKDYILLLQYFYGFFGGLEELITVEQVSPYLSDYESRRKTTSLERDILNCGGSMIQKVGKVELPVIKDINQALGSLYVIEGSSLGGQIISQLIRKQLGLTDNHCLNYFIGYGEHTNAQWQAFKDVIDALPPEAMDNMVEAANQTFTKFEEWMIKHH